MKLIWVLFSLYILALPAIPCGDETNNTIVKHQQTKKTDSSHEDKHEDNCSPFCYCVCCATTTITQHLITNLNITSLKLICKIKFHLTSQKYKSFKNHSIWQPPRQVC
jgi:hypothetical protein